MIDLDKMEASVNQLMRMYPKDTRATQSIGEVNELITRLRQAEKDAARYRWLRSCDTAESKKFVSESGGWIVGLGVLDGMIDEAMQCK